MARRKKTTRRGGVRRAASGVRRVYRRTRSTKTGAIVMDTVVTGTSLLGSTALVNMTPMVSTWPNWIKAGVQGGVGVVLMNQRDPLFKKAGMGTTIGAFVTLVLPFVRQWLPDVALFGGGRRLSPEQLRRMQSRMGIPYTPGNNNMGMAYHPTNNGKMGVPYTPEMAGKRYHKF